MLSKHKVEALAQAIVEATKSDADEQRERNARGAPIALRIQGIKELPKRVQDSLVREAFVAAKASKSTRIAAALWGVICLVGWLLAETYLTSAGSIALMLLTLGILAILTVATRKELLKMVREFKSCKV